MSAVTIVRSGEIMAAEINAIKGQTRQVVLVNALEIGKRLIEAKGLIPHGSWGAWLEENVKYSERTAQDLMRCYEEYGKNANPQALADLSYTKAVALLALPGAERTELIESGKIESMSTRELQVEINRLREEIGQQQTRIDDLLCDSQAKRDADLLIEELRKKTADASEKAKAENDRAKDALKRADDLSKQNADLRSQVQTLQAEPPEREIIEVVPENVLAELEQLRGKTAQSEQVTRLRAGYERLTEEFRNVARLLRAVEAVDAGEAGRYSAAIRKACENMAAQLGG